MKRINVFTLVLFLLFSVKAFSTDQLPEGVTKVTTVEGITEYALDNGLKVLLFPDNSKPTITVNVTYLVGSRHEGYGETGMAHLLEHLVFKGTPDHPDIPAELTEHGASPNGTTWYDRTNYFETFSATEENLNWALDMESDRMINSFIAQEDLDSEMTVVRNEFESGENRPSGVLMKRVLGAAFQWHNYGKSTIGARADIENVPIDRLQAFYKKYYQPDNAVVLVAGKFDEEHTIGLVNDYFGKIPRPDRKLFGTYTKEPTQDGERNITLKRVGDVQSVACVYHTAPGPHSDYAAVTVIDELISNQPGGRLYKSMVETNQASTVWSFAPSLREGGYIYVNADVRKEKDLEEAKTTMLATLDGLVTNPPTPEEVERSKARILKFWNLSYNNSGRVGMRLSEYIAQGDWRLFFLFRDRIESVTTEDVVRVANKYFIPSNRTIGMFIPEDAPERVDIPETPDVNSLLADYKGKEEIAKGEEFDPSPANIEKRTSHTESPNGMKFAFLPKENRGDAVSAFIKFRFGSPKALVGKSTVGNLTGMMLDKGTTSMTRQEIQDKLDELEANVGVFGNSSGVSARIETTNENLPEVIDMVHDMFRNPTFSEEEFNNLKEEQLAAIEVNLSDPQGIASNVFGKSLSPYPKSDVRYVKTFEEEIEAIKATTLDDVKEFYGSFYGASDGSATIVGDFEDEVVKQKIMDHFGDWESPATYNRIASPYIAAETGIKDFETPDKANSMFLAGMNIPISDSHDDYAALVMGNFILGGGFLNSRLATRIRQEEGLSYGVGSFFNAQALDESANFGAYAIYAPENRNKVQDAFEEEINKVLTDGFTQEELDAAKSGWLQSQTVSRSRDGSLVSKLNNYMVYGRSIMWDAELEDKISKLTVNEINAAMTKHIDLKKMVFVRAGDFANKLNKKIKP